MTTSHASRLVLIGAGHAHLHLVRYRARLPHDEVLLVDPGSFWYSGMANGVLGGQHPPAADRLDPARLARRHGVISVRARLTALNLARREVRLDNGQSLPFSALSLNLGSRVHCPPPHPEGPAVWSVKPIPRLVALRHRLTRDFAQGQAPRLVVVGGGASGVEAACNLRALAEHHGVTPSIVLVTRGERLLKGAPEGAVRWLQRHLAHRGIDVRTATQVKGHTIGGVMVADADQAWGEDSYRLLEAAHVVHAGGLAPPELIERLGLPILPGRGLAVEDTLQSPADPSIFASGDCAAMRRYCLPCLGVYGVRQAPVLRHNLAAQLEGRALSPYHPQPRALAILALGKGQGLAIRGRRWWAGRLAMGWKRWLDARFLAQYR